MLKLNKRGMTLNEIMLAVSILAISFIPIIGVMSSSMKTTEKDDHIIKGVSLCQEKLSAALQFPFDKIPAGTYTADIVSDNTDNPLVVKLGADDFRIRYVSILTVTDEDVNYQVPMCDFTEKGRNPSDPKQWMTLTPVQIKNMVKRYTVTVKWFEKEKPNEEKFYTLSALKVNVRR